MTGPDETSTVTGTESARWEQPWGYGLRIGGVAEVLEAAGRAALARNGAKLIPITT